MVHAYEEYGTDMLSKLRGMFSFVIWDSKNKTAFGARDHFGIKPFYYSQINGSLAFSSEIKAILEFPGFKKEDVQAKLENGYLTVSASKGLNRDEKDKKGRYIRRERYAGQCSRSFYVGDDVEPEQVSAKFEDGILKLTVPKKAEKKLPEQSSIQIN